MRFPGHSGKLVRICEITRNFHRCKIFLIFFANFCKREAWYESNESRVRAASCKSRARPFSELQARYPVIYRVCMRRLVARLHIGQLWVVLAETLPHANHLIWGEEESAHTYIAQAVSFPDGSHDSDRPMRMGA